MINKNDFFKHDEHHNDSKSDASSQKNSSSNIGQLTGSNDSNSNDEMASPLNQTNEFIIIFRIVNLKCIS